MQPPDVVTSMRDRARGNLFHVYAYRPLTREEVLSAIAMFYGQKGNKKYLKKGKGKGERIIQILTVHH